MTSANAASCPIAIIGLGCRYPDARNPSELWENVLTQRQSFRRMPDERLPHSEYGDSDKNAPDKTYLERAAVIDGFEFDWARRRIPKQVYEQTDITHWLALDVALQALNDAGYEASELPRDRTGAVSPIAEGQNRLPSVWSGLQPYERVRGLPATLQALPEASWHGGPLYLPAAATLLNARVHRRQAPPAAPPATAAADPRATSRVPLPRAASPRSPSAEAHCVGVHHPPVVLERAGARVEVHLEE